MPKESILVVEDEEDILELVKYNLAKEGYRVSGATSGEVGLKTARSSLPDLIVLDLMLPGIDGLEVCKILKNDSKTQHIPVIMLTAKSEDSDIITGLEIGADDYLAKPFTPKVLIARVRTVLRRKAKANVKETATVRVHDIVIDPGRHEVTVAGEVVDLTLTEFLILHLLARHPGWVFSRYQIVNEIRGEETIVTDRAVDVQIVGLRRKLGDAGKYVETVRGVGYKLSE
ncbi:MAG: response regulator transcription factor [candidate division Zixibacteria bacterium]|nr:response regulator transcription factor [candidate division Zixibacteria bacterium]